jgi:hypothetical protein
MNIFVLDQDPVVAAQMMCDEHIIKMPTESLQMLSTNYRLLDGRKIDFIKPNGKKQTMFLMDGEQVALKKFTEEGEFIPESKQRFTIVDPIIFRNTHENHECNIWTRDSTGNYEWHYKLFCAMLDEFFIRNGKMHACEWGRSWMAEPPKNLKKGRFYAQPECMPTEFKRKTVVESYRNFYIEDKLFASYNRGRNAPAWFTEGRLCKS